MIEYFEGLPYPIAVASLFVIVVLRAGASYAVGRGLEAGANRTRMRRVLEGDRFRRARALVERWGSPIVALSFLTIGFQTVANVAAGVARMPVRRYGPALAVGGLVWAFVYATVGVLGFAGFAQLYVLSPVTAILAGVGIATGVTAFVVFRFRSHGGHGGPDDEVIDDQPGTADDAAPEQLTLEADRLAAHDRRG